MAKKKGGKKGKGKKKSGMGFNTSKLIGMAGGTFVEAKFLDDFLGKYITDPKMKAVAMIAIGEYAPKQDFVKNFMKDEEILKGAGDALTVLGIKSLLAEMGIAGIGAPDDEKDELAVVIEGVEDTDMDEDILGEDDDLNVVNEDVLGDDDLNVVNEDILGDDDDDF